MRVLFCASAGSGSASMASTSSWWAVSTSPSPLSRWYAPATAPAREPPYCGSARRAASIRAGTSLRSPVTVAPRYAASARRLLRSVPAGLRSAERSSSLMAPSESPRKRLVCATSCRRAATCSSGPVAASARCQAWRVGSSMRRAARMRCDCWRSSIVDSSTTADLISGWRKEIRAAAWSSVTSRWRSASCSAADSSLSSTPRSPVASSTASSSAARQAAGSARMRPANTDWRRWVSGSVSGSGPGDVPGNLQQGHWQLEQRQWVAPRLGQQPLGHPRRQRRIAQGEQPRRGLRGQRAKIMSGDAGVVERLRLAGAGRGEHADARPRGPAGDEAERGNGHRVEPRQIVDDHEHRTRPRCVMEQLQDGRGHDEAVRGRGLGQPERRIEGDLPGPGQFGDRSEQRIQDLVQAGEAQPRLELRTGGAQYPHPGGAGMVHRRLQERGLPDSRVTGEQQRLAVTGTAVDEAPRPARGRAHVRRAPAIARRHPCPRRNPTHPPTPVAGADGVI